MRDIYTESVVPIVPDPKDAIMKWIYVALLVASGGMVLFAGALFLIPAALFAFLLYRVMGRQNREYEYVHTNDLFDIDMVTRSSKRRAMVTVKLHEVVLVAPSDSEELEAFRNAKFSDYSGGAARDPYIMVAVRDGKYAQVLLDLDENMIRSLKQWIPDRVRMRIR